MTPSDQHRSDCLDAAEGEPDVAERVAKALGDGGGWVDHDGGPCPFPQIEVRLADGHLERGDPRDFYWRHPGTNNDIVAYRLLGPLPAALVKGD